MIVPMGSGEIDAQQLAERLVARAKAEGLELLGPGGLLTGLTKTVLETALEVEMSDHLGYDKHDHAGRNGGNSRNGTRSKTVFTEVGPWRSRCRGTGMAVSSRVSCVSGSVGSRASTRSCSRCPRVG